jgi:hypothetical protein
MDGGVDAPADVVLVVAGDGSGATGGATVDGAGIAGRRASACSAKRSAADFVRMYPAVYTARIAAELSATRPFEIFLWEPSFDTHAIIVRRTLSTRVGERQRVESLPPHVYNPQLCGLAEIHQFTNSPIDLIARPPLQAAARTARQRAARR